MSSVEETALALDALVSVALASGPPTADSVANGLAERNLRGDLGVKSAASNVNHRLGDSLTDCESACTVEQPHREAIIRGVECLLGSVGRDRHREPWPIGFYFAKLWYHERLYPLIFTVSALGKYNSLVTEQPNACWPR